MPNGKFFLVTESERKHVRRRARFQQHRDASCHQVFFLQGKALKEIHATLTETLGEHAPSYATVKYWVAQFKRGDFSTCDAPRPGRPKTVTTREIIDQIHELILEERRISSKSIAEQLGISCEQVGSIIQEDLDMRELSAKWVPKFIKYRLCSAVYFRKGGLDFYRLTRIPYRYSTIVKVRQQHMMKSVHLPILYLTDL